MLDQLFDPASRDLLRMLLVATSTCSAILVVSWPYIGHGALEARMRRVAKEREQLRLRERRRLGANGPISLIRRPPNRLLTRIVQSTGVKQALPDGKLALTLARAGFRGNSAIVTYLAARTLTPAATFALGLFYIFVVLDPVLPASVKLLIAAAVGALGFYLPTVYVKNRTIKRQQSIERAWPDAVDLLLICIEAGMSIDPALQKVAEEIGAQSPDLAEEMGLTTAELSFLPDRRQAFENLAQRTGLESVKAVVASLKQAEKHGTSLGRSLRVLAQENRNMRLSMAEKKAAALPPKLTVPMIIFFLPVLFVVIITPAAIQIADM